MLNSLNVAVAHDVLINSGGAERVTAIFAEAFPDAPIYTCAYHPEKTFPIFKEREIRTTFMQKFPHNEKLIKLAFPLCVAGIESFDFRGFDLVLSSSTFLVKGIITPPETCHVSLIHNVFRLLWLKGTYEKGGRRRNLLLDGLLTPIRLWDLAASQRPDYVLTNSEVTRRRIRKYYRREPSVFNPPVDFSVYQVSNVHDDYFLVVSRLEPYKRVDIAVDAFNRLGRRLVIVGDGSMRKELEKQANKNIEFLGVVTDELLSELYCKAQALIFPGEEDYGLVPIEAQASGRPVIAYRAGGVLETVNEDSSVLFSPQSSEALISAVREFDVRTFDPETIRSRALRFDKVTFIQRLRAHVEECFLDYSEGKGVSSQPSAFKS